MKPLILSFFAVILFYSLFIDKNEEQEVKKDVPVDTRSTRSLYNTVDTIETADSVIFYASRPMYEFNSFN